MHIHPLDKCGGHMPGWSRSRNNVGIDEIHNQRSAVRRAELSRLGKSSVVNGAAIKRRPKVGT